MSDMQDESAMNRFFAAGDGIAALDLPERAPDAESPPSALQRLGAPPFPKSKFPFLGFLASVYDHVASHAKGRQPK